MGNKEEKLLIQMSRSGYITLDILQIWHSSVVKTTSRSPLTSLINETIISVEETGILDVTLRALNVMFSFLYCKKQFIGPLFSLLLNEENKILHK